MTGNAHPRYPGTVKHIIFHSGVLKKFVVVGFGVNVLQPSGPLHPIDFQNVHEKVEGRDVVSIVAQNVSEEAAEFCFQIVMEVADDVWLAERDGVE